MEVFFNELSFRTIEYEDIKRLSEVYGILKHCGVNVCRLRPEDYNSIIEGCRKTSNWRDISNWLYAFLQSVFEDQYENELNDYALSVWRYKDKSIYGLALAYILDTAALSFKADEWETNNIEICRDGTAVIVKHVYDKLSADAFAEIIRDSLPVELVKSHILPEAKKINVNVHHGKDELKEFSERIVRSEYVNEVINSLPYNSAERRFIRRVNENGVIEVVLHWTDAGYGVALQTTGRNLRETKRIGELLEKEYGRIK